MLVKKNTRWQSGLVLPTCRKMLLGYNLTFEPTQYTKQLVLLSRRHFKIIT